MGIPFVILKTAKYKKPSEKQHFRLPHIFFKTFLSLFFLVIVSAAVFAQDVLMGLTSTSGLNSGGTAFSFKTADSGFNVLHNFMNIGANPQGDLVKGRDGNFYGMTSKGGKTDNGADGYGTIFRISPTGIVTRMKTFEGNTGINPSGSLLEGNDGNFYGMTSDAGVDNHTGINSMGTIFQITPSGGFLVFRNFSSATGFNPAGSLVYGKDSSFYGTTSKGGAYGFGTIFKMSKNKILSVLKNLDDTITGGSPAGNLLLHTDSSFYGMTSRGGTYGYGTIFRISPSGKFIVLKNFDLKKMGGSPAGSLIKGIDGSLYGMAAKGGTYGSGTIFKLTTTGIFTVLKQLSSSTTGSNPCGSLTLGRDSSFYGMTNKGGSHGYGTIFKITPTGILTKLRNLSSSPGEANPFGSLIQDTDNNFYGMISGGANYGGAIFRISATGSFFTMAKLPDNSAGFSENGSLMQSKDGYYYGMSSNGGSQGFGTVFKMCTGGSFTTLCSFDLYTTGANPNGSLIQAKDGNFYGMTSQGGINSGGTIFKMNSSGKLTVLKNLDDYSGSHPNGSLIQAKDGNFYGITSYGGTYYHGTIFKMDTAGKLTVLKNLDLATTGGYPQGSLLQASDGDFYGMTSAGGLSIYWTGTIFKITASGVFTVLKYFDQNTGSNPYGDLVQGNDGNFYGMTNQAGPNGGGTIFKMSQSGEFTVLKSFGYYTGTFPRGSLVKASNGNFYGVTSGGEEHFGYRSNIFCITPAGIYTILHGFNPGTQGNTPYGNLILQSADPIANPQSVALTVSTSKKIILTGSGGSPLTYTVDTLPLHGTVSIFKDTLKYIPSAGYIGSDSLTFYATWRCQRSKSAKINMNISGSLNNAPSVSFIFPVRNATYTAPAKILLKSNASDYDGKISKIEFYNGFTLLHTDYLASGNFEWQNVPEGEYSLTATATDNSGLITMSAPVNISVTNLPPIVKISSPFIKNYQSPAKVTLGADATDPDGTIRSVDFYNQEVFLFSRNSPPYSGPYSLPAGSYNIYAKATDNNGKVTTSPPCAFYVQQSVSRAAAISSPVNDTKYLAPEVIPSNVESYTDGGKLRSSPGINKTDDDNITLRLSPNPVRNILTIETNGLRTSKRQTISVIAVSGVIMSTKQLINPMDIGSTHFIQLNVSDLAPGTYTIKLTADKVLYKRFVKL